MSPYGTFPLDCPPSEGTASTKALGTGSIHIKATLDESTVQL